MLIDISQELFSCRIYPGDPRPKREQLLQIKNGDVCNLTTFSMCAHNGTHIDAPRHFFDDGNPVDGLPLEVFVGACYVARCEGEIGAWEAEQLLADACREGAQHRILMAGDAVLTSEGAKVLASGGVRLFGNESQTVGPENAPAEVHRILLGSGIALLEGLVLHGVAEGPYFLSAAPLNLSGADGAPCRAFLITGEDLSSRCRP